jgi:hypothetical protein
MAESITVLVDAPSTLIVPRKTECRYCGNEGQARAQADTEQRQPPIYTLGKVEDKRA